mgnify:CR=1 FL=1
MSYIFGIDVGTNSLGYSLIQENKFLDKGTVIFSYNLKGKEERRFYRNKRVRLKNRKQRKKLLKRELNNLGINFEESSNTFELRKESQNKELSLSDLGKVIYNLNQKRGFKSNRKIKNENQVENRDLVISEFNNILNFQSQFYPSLLTEETRNKLSKIIFFQKLLKSQKKYKGKCAFEKRKFRAPRCSALSQEFRMLCDLNNLKISGEDLNLEQREILINYLKVNSSLNLTKTDFKRGENIELNSKVIKLLGLDKNKSYFVNLEKLNGLDSLSQLSKIVDLEKYSSYQIDKMIHTLNSEYNFELTQQFSIKEWNLTEEQSKSYSKIQLEKGYLNISTKVVKKLLPFLRQGLVYSEAASAAGYCHYALDEIIETEFLNHFPKTNNSVVDKSLNELRILVNSLILKYGKPRIIRIEMCSELKNSKKKREEIQYKQWKNEKENLRILNILKEEFGLRNPNKQDILKYKLWIEQNEICLYSGKEISKEILFSENIEIDHTIPYSRSFDNSFNNLTLTFREVNQLKSNRTPFEFLGENKEITERIKVINKFKQLKFIKTEIPKDFISRQLVDTSYTAKLANKHLKSICKNVEISKGLFTSELRSSWNLNKILNSEGNFKNRQDHRHHAVDAVVIACTSKEMLSSRNFYGNTICFPLPWGSFREDVEKSIKEIVVEHKLNKKKQGKLHDDTFYSQMKERWNKDIPLLEVNRNYKGIGNFKIRKPLHSFNSTKQIYKIIDKNIKEIIFKRLIEFGIPEQDLKEEKNLPIPKQAFEKELIIPSKKGKFEPIIKSVKIKVKSSKAFNIKGNRWVENSLNYCYNIFEDKNGKKSGKIVTMFEACQKDFEFPKDENYLFSLFKNDLWYFGERNEEFDAEKVFRVIRITEGMISFQKSYLLNAISILGVAPSKLTGVKL